MGYKSPNRLFYAIFILLFLTIVSQPAKGQALIALLLGDKVGSDNVKMGLFLGEQGSYISNANTTSFKPNLSLAIGAYVDVKIDKNNKWFIQNYLLFKAPKGASGLDVNKESFPVDTFITAHTDMIKRSLTYLQLTPVVRYCFTPSWSVGLGPYVGFLIKGTDTYSAHLDKGDLAHTMKMTNNYRTVECGLAFDVQYRLLKGRGIQVNLRYELGLLNVYKSNTGMNGLNRAFHLGVGIPILGNKK